MSHEFPEHLADQFLEDIRRRPTTEHPESQVIDVRKKVAETRFQLMRGKPPGIEYKVFDTRLQQSYTVRRQVDGQFLKGMEHVLKSFQNKG